MDEKAVCQCGHPKREHYFIGMEPRGSCLHWYEGPEKYCPCEEFREKKEAGK